MVSMKLCNFVVFVIGMVIGGAIMGASARFPMEITEQGPGPGFWPFLLGLALTVAALALAVYTLYHRHELTEEKVALGTGANRQVYVVMAMIVVFCGLIHLTGFYAAAMLLVPCLMYRLECRDKKRMLLTALCVTLFIYLVFGQLLHTSLPSSVFFD
ncbi:MAG: tripartite tricarboxylate transporter TctB family protein [Acidaminococcaceae bacterium]|nr:tripartite tricarboxylate transporter TctB family protein [Acidaminococcaceae bacterium]MBO6039073.1 tripartite tricarboxylate transporter TctB family protein [Acidaminococcaceae bacterium]MBP5736615.1 tripartite tricarboxylate transporter TctB family protein [Acidaminococcaceae bacterium]